MCKVHPQLCESPDDPSLRQRSCSLYRGLVSPEEVNARRARLGAASIPRLLEEAPMVTTPRPSQHGDWVPAVGLCSEGVCSIEESQRHCHSSAAHELARRRSRIICDVPPNCCEHVWNVAAPVALLLPLRSHLARGEV